MNQMKRKKIKKSECSIFDGRIVHPTRHVLKLFDLDPERFRKWIEAGFIKPDIKARGTGSTNYFLKQHLYIIGVFTKMVEAGINRLISSEVAYYLDMETLAYISDLKDDFYLIVIGDVNPKKDRDWKKNIKIFVKPSPELELTNLAKKSGFEIAIIVNLYKVISYVDSNIE